MFVQNTNIIHCLIGGYYTCTAIVSLVLTTNIRQGLKNLVGDKRSSLFEAKKKFCEVDTCRINVFGTSRSFRFRHLERKKSKMKVCGRKILSAAT